MMTTLFKRYERHLEQLEKENAELKEERELIIQRAENAEHNFSLENDKCEELEKGIQELVDAMSHIFNCVLTDEQYCEYKKLIAKYSES